VDKVKPQMPEHSLLMHYNLEIEKQPNKIEFQLNSILFKFTLFSSIINVKTRIHKSTPSNSRGR
jgi:hypothetical protein